MNIELRYHDKAPAVDNVERLIIKYGELDIEILPSPNTEGDGIRIRLAGPIAGHLVIVPLTNNIIDIHNYRFDK